MSSPFPSQKLIDFIVECEVSSRAYYEKNYQRPEWPGGASGVTIGIGYDLGYASEEKIKRDWGNKVSLGMLSVMLRCAGITGDAAKDLCRKVRTEILIPWNDAMDVFIARDVPQYLGELIRAIPKAADIPPDCLGVLLSIGYNRGNGGWSSSKDRYREMRAIRDLIDVGEIDAVAPQIRHMSRLWPSDDTRRPDKGLRARREREAALWERGIKNSAPAATVAAATPSPPRTMPAPPVAAPEQGTAGATILATGGAAKVASDAGWSGSELVMLVVVGLAAAVILGIIINKARASMSPTIARAKDIEP